MQHYSDAINFDPSHPRISHPITKVSKKLLASQVNSVRPYKSRSKRPCDFCRRRKTCCIIEGSIPCMSCRQFNKGQCTFVEKPLKRSKRDSLSEKADSNPAAPISTKGKGRKNARRSISTHTHSDRSGSTYDVADRKAHSYLHSHRYSHPNLNSNLNLNSDTNTNTNSSSNQNQNSHGNSQMSLTKLGGLLPQASFQDYMSWPQAWDSSSRSKSTGNIHSQNCTAQAYARGQLFVDPIDSVPAQTTAPIDTPLYQELVNEYRQYAIQQQQHQQHQQHHQQQQSSLQASMDLYSNLDSFDSHLYSQNYTSVPYNYYGASEPDKGPQLDNSEFVSSASNSISMSSSRISSSLWSPQATLDSGLGSAIESAIDSVIDLSEALDAPESVHDADYSHGVKHPMGSQIKNVPFQLPSQSQSQQVYGDTATRNNGLSGNNGWFLGANGAISIQNGVYQATNM